MVSLHSESSVSLPPDDGGGGSGQEDSPDFLSEDDRDVEASSKRRCTLPRPGAQDDRAGKIRLCREESPQISSTRKEECWSQQNSAGSSEEGCPPGIAAATEERTGTPPLTRCNRRPTEEDPRREKVRATSVLRGILTAGIRHHGGSVLACPQENEANHPLR